MGRDNKYKHLRLIKYRENEAQFIFFILKINFIEL